MVSPLFLECRMSCLCTSIPSSHELSIFNLRPTVPDTLAGASQPPQDPAEPPTTPRRRAVRGGAGLDSLSTLPYEVLCHMASFLDSLSLSQLALVSRLMREVCSSLLQGRGMVTLRWEKKTYSHGGARWRPKTVPARESNPAWFILEYKKSKMFLLPMFFFSPLLLGLGVQPPVLPCEVMAFCKCPLHHCSS